MMREREGMWLEVTGHDVIGLKESRKSLGLEWHQETWIPHSVHMVYTYMTEIKEYDVRAHVYYINSQ